MFRIGYGYDLLILLLLVFVCQDCVGYLAISRCILTNNRNNHQHCPSKYSTSKLNSINLHGSPQTRSPLINWYLIEKDIPFIQKPPRPSKHPFGQIPFLTDDNDVEVFESGAILLYLADAYGGYNTPSDRAKYTKWVVWANSELDGLCFKSRGSMIDKPNRAMDILENILQSTEYLVDNKFSVADVAVASYLNYVPVFFRDVNPSNRPNLVRYMQRNGARPAFTKAFGEEHAQLIASKTAEWLGNENKSNSKKGIFGSMF